MNKPNIILIMTDQHRLSAMGCYGDTPCRTPNLDRIAERGFLFRTAYTTFPVCTPARASVITGHFPHRHGMTSNTDNIGASVHELQDRPQLLSRRLLEGGYRCGYTGKWHLGTEWDSIFDQPTTPSLPKHVGFEGQNFAGHGAGGFHYDEYKEYLKENGWEHKVEHAHKGPATRGCGVLQGPIESTVPYFLTQHSIDLIDRYRNDDKPFFIWHNFWGPHSPYFAAQKYYDMYKDVEIPEWPNYRWEEASDNTPASINRTPGSSDIPWEDMAEAVRYYYAFTSMIDDQIGRLVQKLEDDNLIDNTVILFTADHGESLGDHGGIRNKGWTHFEETQRIPMIAYVPEAYRKGGTAGSVLEQFTSLSDIYPTICGLAGAEYNQENIHGQSLIPLISGEQQKRDEVFVEFFGLASLTGTMFTCRAGNLKYGWNAGSKDELYDLDRDPHELHNAIDDPEYKDIPAQMNKRIADWLERTHFNKSGLNTFRKCTGTK